MNMNLRTSLALAHKRKNNIYDVSFNAIEGAVDVISASKPKVTMPDAIPLANSNGNGQNVSHILA